MRRMNKTALLLYLLISTSLYAQQHWQNVKGGVGNSDINQHVSALLNDTAHHVLYVSGSFKVADDTVSSAGWAIWDGTKWSTNNPYPSGGTGLPSTRALALFNGYIYGGTNGTVFHNNGSQWILDGDFDGAIKCFCIYHNKLYAGGKFSSVNGVTAYRIACYDGVKWDSVGGGVYWSQACCSSVEAMCVWRDKLVVGGTFDRAVNPDGSEIPAGSIVLWNDTSWSAIGEMTQQTTGVNTGYLFSLGVYKGDLIAGGGSQFDFADGVSVRGIARYDGSNWYSLANGVNNEVRCMIEKDSSLYVGGSVYIGNTDYDSYGVLRWDGMNFNKIDSGLGNVNALAIYDDVLYAGGSFNKRGMKNIARLVPDTIHVGVTEVGAGKIYLYPNPVTEQLMVVSEQRTASYEIQNMLGQTILRKTQDTRRKTEIDVSNLPQGMYLLRMRTKEGWSIGKFVKQ